MSGNIYALGRAYEEQTAHISKKIGRYYTPEYIVDFIVENTLGDICREKSKLSRETGRNEFLSIKILDPAMGFGYFLYKAMTFIAEFAEKEVFIEKGLSPEKRKTKILKDVALSSIYGIDLDMMAVVGAVDFFNDSLSLSPEERKILEDHFVVCDALLDIKKCRTFPKSGFDVIIGNPPYLYKRSQDDKYIDAGFQYAKGQFDLYWLFYEQAFKGVLKKGGIHGFIIPDGFLVRDRASHVRRELAEKYSIMSISVCEDVFQTARVSCVVLIWEKSSFTCKNKVDLFELSPGLTFERTGCVSQADFLISPKSRWETNPKNKMSFKNCVKLKDIAMVSRGEETGKKNLFAEREKGCKPIICGEDIGVFEEISHKYYVKNVFKPIENYASPKILVPKTGDKIKAGIDYNDRITLQSVYNISLINKDYLCSFVAGILNSDFMKDYIKDTFTAYKKVFPQLNQSTIKEISIPKIKCDSHRIKSIKRDMVFSIESSDKDFMADMISALYEISVCADEMEKSKYMNILNFLVRKIYEE